MLLLQSVTTCSSISSLQPYLSAISSYVVCGSNLPLFSLTSVPVTLVASTTHHSSLSQHLCDFTRTQKGQRRETHLRAQILAAVPFRPSYQLHCAFRCRWPWVHRRSASLFILLNPGIVAPATNLRLPPLKPEPADYNYGFGATMIYLLIHQRFDMKKKEKKLQSKEAELRRREQVYT
ncbi:hypothetical protein HN51_071174 [Arachis hypogaea]